jgi:hypothetical protein
VVNSPVRRHVGIPRTSRWAGLKRWCARLPGARFCRPFRWNLRRIVWRARPSAAMASLRPRWINAAHLVRRYQIATGGYWLLCYCRPEADRPPVLMPVAETHSQRQLSTQSLHTSACEAIQEPDAQRSWAPTALRQSQTPACPGDHPESTRNVVRPRPTEGDGRTTPCQKPKRLKGIEPSATVSGSRQMIPRAPAWLA